MEQLQRWILLAVAKLLVWWKASHLQVQIQVEKELYILKIISGSYEFLGHVFDDRFVVFNLAQV